MREASLFVRPSSLEGMPLTVLEAMATALPVVATPIAGTGELIQDGLNGHIVQVDDTAALANAVIKLLDDRSAAEKMGRNGRALVEGSYTWDAVVERTEHIYTEMLFYK
jgi:glycosyltransferase involved in cell wall biosynthesis